MHQYSSSSFQALVYKLITLLKILCQIGLVTVFLFNLQVNKLLRISWLTFVVDHQDVCYLALAQYLETL